MSFILQQREILNFQAKSSLLQIGYSEFVLSSTIGIADLFSSPEGHNAYSTSNHKQVVELYVNLKNKLRSNETNERKKITILEDITKFKKMKPIPPTP